MTVDGGRALLAAISLGLAIYAGIMQRELTAMTREAESARSLNHRCEQVVVAKAARVELFEQLMQVAGHPLPQQTDLVGGIGGGP